MLHINFRIGHLSWEDKLSTLVLQLSKYIEFHKLPPAATRTSYLRSQFLYLLYSCIQKSVSPHAGCVWVEVISRGGSLGQALRHTGGQRGPVSLIAQRQSRILMLSSCWGFRGGQQWSCSNKTRINRIKCRRSY